MWSAVLQKAWMFYFIPVVCQHFFQLPICPTIWVTVRLFFLCTNLQLDWQMLFIMARARRSPLYPSLFVIHVYHKLQLGERSLGLISWMCYNVIIVANWNTTKRSVLIGFLGVQYGNTACWRIFVGVWPTILVQLLAEWLKNALMFVYIVAQVCQKWL